MGKRARRHSTDEGQTEQVGPTPGLPQALAVHAARTTITFVYYALPIGLIAAAALTLVIGIGAGPAERVLAGALAFFLPVGWGAVLLVVEGEQVRGLLAQRGSDLLVAALACGVALGVGWLAFGPLGTPTWQMFALGLLTATVFMSWSTQDHESLLHKVLSGAGRTTLLAVMTLMTFACAAGIAVGTGVWAV